MGNKATDTQSQNMGWKQTQSSTGYELHWLLTKCVYVQKPHIIGTELPDIEKQEIVTA